MVRDAVTATPGSDAEFPVKWEFTGNSQFFGDQIRFDSCSKPQNFAPSRSISLRIEQGIQITGTGNSEMQSRD